MAPEHTEESRKLSNSTTGAASDSAQNQSYLRDRAIEAAQNGIIITDALRPDNPIVYANPAFLELTGYTEAEVMGRNCRFLQGNDTDQEEISLIREGVRRQLPVRVTLRNYRRDGSTFLNDLTVSPVHDANGSVTHFIGVQNDITAKVESEEKLRQSQEQLEKRVRERTEELTRINDLLKAQILRAEKIEDDLKHSNAELDQFASVASHDLQEPLRMVTSYLQLLERRYNHLFDDDAKEFIGYAIDGASRMKMLVSDLLVYSRIQTLGKPFRATDAQQALERAVENLEVAIRERSVKISSGPLPTVVSDPVQLTQLFQNLLANAVKFADKPRATIKIAAKREDNAWVFSITDNGKGIEAKYLQSIFLIFKQLGSRAERKGSGIGLAISKRIIARHGGRIWAQSRYKEGSTFYFTIPDTPQGDIN